MIIDSIRNREKYYCLGEEYKAALEYCAAAGQHKFEEGDYPLLDGRVVMKNRNIVTKPLEDCKWECHKKFVDVHYVVSGHEKIGYADAKNMVIISENEEADMVYLAGDADCGAHLPLEPGYFMIAFPDDAHLPSIAIGECEAYEKIVAKIPV